MTPEESTGELVEIEESGMCFGPYPEELCFRIETSRVFRHIGSGVKMAEFLLLRQAKSETPSLWIIEAKSSSPRPASKQSFDEYIGEIRDKLANALTLAVSIRLGRHQAEDELPVGFHNIDWQNIKIRLILVIRGHQDAWLPPLKDALEKALNPCIRLWGLKPPAVLVLNDQNAERQGLLKPRGAVA
ncbi:hypothetical protein [Chitinimonas lacunae]|uniref:DUF4365 domain-containing protein n=1 Tax=Chitinimonas lacunae TaxID=1963018 RepID=A0ABV8MXC1_9NEIS